LKFYIYFSPQHQHYEILANKICHQFPTEEVIISKINAFFLHNKYCYTLLKIPYVMTVFLKIPNLLHFSRLYTLVLYTFF